MAITLKFKYLDSMQRSSAKDMLICDWRAKHESPKYSSPLTVSKGRTVDLISLICLAASKATIILKSGKGQQCCWVCPLSARRGWDHRSPRTLCSVAEILLMASWRTFLCVVIDRHELNITPLGFLIGEWPWDYNNVWGKWCFMIETRPERQGFSS